MSNEILTYSPAIGEIRRGRDIGKSDLKYIWAACETCGEARWVQLVKGKPRCRICPPCRDANMRQHGSGSIAWLRGEFVNTWGYVMVYRPQHPSSDRGGYVKRSHLVMEEKIGYSIPKGLVVHHINGVKDDDRPENLVVFTPQEHSRFHMLKDRKCDQMNHCKRRITKC